MSDNAVALPDEPNDGLPYLAPQEEVFVQHLMNGDSQSDAYRKAYGTNGIATDQALWMRASRKANNPAIKAHMDAATLAGAVRVKATLESQAQRLRQLSVKAEAKGELSTAVVAEDKVNKLFGLYVTEDSGREALAQVGAGLVGLVGKELAAQIAKAQGMTLDLVATDVTDSDDTAK